MAIDASQSRAPSRLTQPGRATIKITIDFTSSSLTEHACEAGAVQEPNGWPTSVAPSTATLNVLPHGGQSLSSSSPGPPPPAIAPKRTRTRTVDAQEENRPAKKAKGARNTQAATRPVLCDICGQQLLQQSFKKHKERHDRVHPEGDHECQICYSRCSRKDSLKRHYLKVHGGENTPSSPDTMAAFHSSPDQGTISPPVEPKIFFRIPAPKNLASNKEASERFSIRIIYPGEPPSSASSSSSQSSSDGFDWSQIDPRLWPPDVDFTSRGR